MAMMRTTSIPSTCKQMQHGGWWGSGELRTDHAEHGSEDAVEEAVGERGEGRGAAGHYRRGGRARACCVGDEGWRRAVEITTTLELPTSQCQHSDSPSFSPSTRETYRSLHKALYSPILLHPNVKEVALRIQRKNPKEDADTQRKDRADGNHAHRDLQPAPRGRREPGKRHYEGDEDESRVDEARVKGEPLVEEVARRLLALLGLIVHRVAHDEREGEEDGAGGEEEEVRRHRREEDLVHAHAGCLAPFVLGERSPGVRMSGGIAIERFVPVRVVRRQGIWGSCFCRFSVYIEAK